MSSHDIVTIFDVAIGSLVAGGVRLIVLKSFLEPAAFWAGRKGWHFLDWALNDRLPDLKL